VVYNKIDLQGLPAAVKRDEYGKIVSIHLSAKSGAGLEDLRAAMIETRDNPVIAAAPQEWHPLNNN
jgi:GTP-binding protein HflX